jgi:hypothetical protein
LDCTGVPDRLLPHFKQYAICSSLQPSSEHHKLTCYYFNNNRNPRLVISPAKVEVVYPDPKIYVLRGFLDEAEMNRLKELAAPKVCAWQ